MKTPGLTRNNCKTVLDDDYILLFFIFITVLSYILRTIYFIIYGAPLYSLLTKTIIFHLFNYNHLANTH